MELAKRDKKIAREIIEKGLQREFALGLNKADEIIGKWKNNDLENREAYHSIYRHIIDFDKHIGRRYNNMTGSRYRFIIAGQLADGIISESELEGFPDEVRNALKVMAGIC